MTNIVEEWSSLEDYAKRCRYGCYQIRETIDGREVRVLVGRFGYIKTFKDPKDPQLQRIVSFCESEGYIKVCGNIPDEQFFAD